MKRNALLISALVLVLLQGCGGGGNDAPASPEQPAPAPSDAPPPETQGPLPLLENDGSVSAPFVRTDRSRYMLISAGGSSFDALTDAEQADSGAMTRLNATRLGGDSVTGEIAGDASFAMGRWVKGTVTGATGAETLTGGNDHSYHYAAYNIPASFPATGDYRCGANPDFATPPTRVSASGSGPDGGGISTGDFPCFGPANGPRLCDHRIRLNFDDAGAHISTTLGSQANGFGPGGSLSVGIVQIYVIDPSSGFLLMNMANTDVPLPELIPAPASLAVGGDFLADGSGTQVQVTDAGNGNYALMVAYAAKFEISADNPNYNAGNALYKGIAHFSCALAD